MMTAGLSGVVAAKVPGDTWVGNVAAGTVARWPTTRPTRFAALVALGDRSCPLDEACAAVAAHARPELDLGAELARLDELAAGVGGADRRRPARATCSTTSASPATGRPTTTPGTRCCPTCSIAAWASRSRWPSWPWRWAAGAACRCVGVGMPGHFLVRPADDPDRFLDLFDGGRASIGAAAGRSSTASHPRRPWDDALPRAGRAPRPSWRGCWPTWPAPTAERGTGERCAGRSTCGCCSREPPSATGASWRCSWARSGRFAEAADVLEATGRGRATSGCRPAAGPPELSSAPLVT